MCAVPWYTTKPKAQDTEVCAHIFKKFLIQPSLLQTIVPRKNISAMWEAEIQRIWWPGNEKKNACILFEGFPNKLYLWKPMSRLLILVCQSDIFKVKILHWLMYLVAGFLVPSQNHVPKVSAILTPPQYWFWVTKISFIFFEWYSVASWTQSAADVLLHLFLYTGPQDSLTQKTKLPAISLLTQ